MALYVPYMTGLDMFVSGDGIMEVFHFHIMHACNVKPPPVLKSENQKAI